MWNRLAAEIEAYETLYRALSETELDESLRDVSPDLNLVVVGRISHSQNQTCQTSRNSDPLNSEAC
jgi:hypothetical protein